MFYAFVIGNSPRPTVCAHPRSLVLALEGLAYMRSTCTFQTWFSSQNPQFATVSMKPPSKRAYSVHSAFLDGFKCLPI